MVSKGSENPVQQYIRSCVTVWELVEVPSSSSSSSLSDFDDLKRNNEKAWCKGVLEEQQYKEK